MRLVVPEHQSGHGHGAVAVATFAIGEAGAANAGLFATALLARHDAAIAERFEAFRAAQSEAILAMVLPGQG